MAEHAHDIAKHVKVYIVIFAVLMVLTLVTVGVSYLELSIMSAVIVAMFVASIKGSLVACYFMHLIDERKIIYWVLALTVFFFIVLMAIPSLDVHSGEGVVVNR